jgi:hypothetical protein
VGDEHTQSASQVQIQEAERELERTSGATRAASKMSGAWVGGKHETLATSGGLIQIDQHRQ